jgi:hypothetical protein
MVGILIDAVDPPRMRARTDPSWYRQEAERLCQRAAMITNDDKLRDSYLSLACECEKLAEDFGRPPDHLVETTGPERCDPTPARL